MAFRFSMPQPDNQPPLLAHDLRITVNNIDVAVKPLHHPDDRMITVTYRLPPRSVGLPSYMHPAVAKLLYVQRGTLAVALDADIRTVAAGYFVPIAAGVLHTYWNETNEDIRFVVCFSSIDMQVVFDEIAALTVTNMVTHIA